MDEPSQLPPPGWYLDPAGSGGQRWWDGAAWTDDLYPAARASGWDAAGPPPGEPVRSVSPAHTAAPGTDAPAPGAPAPAPAPAGAAYYAGVQSPLAPSGMRRVPALFSDVGTIIRRAWLQVVGVSLLIWGVWSLIVLAALLWLLDMPAVGSLVDVIDDSAAGQLDDAERRVEEALEDLISAPGSMVVLVSVTVLLLTVFASTYQAAAVNSLGRDAIAGHPQRFGTALARGFWGGLRLAGYLLILTVVGAAFGAALGGALALMAQSDAPGWLAGLLGFLGFVVGLLVLFWLLGRLLPVSVQVLSGGRALSWTWRATKGRFWPVVGRYLLWSIVASVVVNVIGSVLFALFAGLVGAVSVASDPTTLAWFTLLALVVVMYVSFVLTAVSYLGVVPIWRDLTDEPTYRSIGGDGQPVPAAYEE